jgi:diadenosine tetraphosphate (Ap4A) HIT family hydrolase
MAKTRHECKGRKARGLKAFESVGRRHNKGLKQKWLSKNRADRRNFILDDFMLDHRLAADTLPVMPLGLCALMLMKDVRWPWLLLVPQRANITELYQLTPDDQAALMSETAHVSKALAGLTGCHKLNIGALGNVVPQFHMHIVARHEGDANWPKPVWGFGGKLPYEDAAAQRFIDRLRAAL